MLPANIFAQRFAPTAPIARPIGGGGIVNPYAPGGAHMMPYGGPVRPVMGLPRMGVQGMPIQGMPAPGISTPGGTVRPRPVSNMMPPVMPPVSTGGLMQPQNAMRMRIGLR